LQVVGALQRAAVPQTVVDPVAQHPERQSEHCLAGATGEVVAAGRVAPSQICVALQYRQPAVGDAGVGFATQTVLAVFAVGQHCVG